MTLSYDTLLRLSERIPRYTSYPTAPSWRVDLRPEDEAARQARLPAPASVYVHIPFCVEQCSFCACNQVVAGRRDAATRYLNALDVQLRGLPLPAETHPIVRMAWGGGTPTWLSPEELTRLHRLLTRRLVPIDGAELDVELDPEITSAEQLQVLAGLGATRVSMGVQSFDAGVLEAVGRPQRAERVAAVLSEARALGMRGLNIDLMYGLPRQGLAVFAQDLAETIRLNPDRIAVFGYAHVPWLKPHQRRLDAFPRPEGEERLQLFLLAHETLRAAGYEPIGFDHFARPDDALAEAARERRLHRNFMGYTTRPDLEQLGLGVSAISEHHDAWFQQTSKLSTWWRQAEAGLPTLERGALLTPEDQLRKHIINQIMCNLALDFEELAARFDLDAPIDLAPELASLAPLEALGLVQVTPWGLQVTEAGRLVVRNVAAAFDPGLAAPQRAPRFSQAV